MTRIKSMPFNHRFKLFLLISLLTYAAPTQSAQQMAGVAPVKSLAQQAARALQDVLPPPGLPRLVVSFMVMKTIKEVYKLQPYYESFARNESPLSQEYVTAIASSRFLGCTSAYNRLELTPPNGSPILLQLPVNMRTIESIDPNGSYQGAKHTDSLLYAKVESNTDTYSLRFSCDPDTKRLQKALTLLEKAKE